MSTLPKLALLLLPVSFSIGFGWPQQGAKNVGFRAHKISDALYMLESGRAGNLGVLIGEDGTLMIDDQFAPFADKILEAIGKVGGEQPRFVLNTHWHGDHTGGNPVFGKQGTIVAHANVRKRLTTDQQVRGRQVPAMEKAGWPVITYEQGLSLHLNGEEIELLHTPNGHTDGDSVIFFKQAKAVHMGDQFFTGRFPFIDLGSGGSVDGMIRNVGKVLERLPEEASVIPGHGPLAGVKELREYHEMLVATRAAVVAQKTAGKSLEEIQAAGLDPKWKSWGIGFINEAAWIEIVFRSTP